MTKEKNCQTHRLITPSYWGHNRLLTRNNVYFSFQRLSFDLLVANDLTCQPNGHRGNRTHSSILQRFYRPPLLLKGLYVHNGIPNNLTDSCYELPCISQASDYRRFFGTFSSPRLLVFSSCFLRWIFVSTSYNCRLSSNVQSLILRLDSSECYLT